MMGLHRFWLASTTAIAALYFTASNAISCSPYNIPYPSVANGSILALAASPVTNYPSGNSTLNFCNVTITYTHPDWNDKIHVTVWLPFSEWNKRLQGAGGGGYAATYGDRGLVRAVASNWAVVGTDAGHDPSDLQTSASWALDASGKPNLNLFKDFASVALNDAAVIGKQVVHSFYGHGPRYSYWNGCSTGGRQGLMLAQRYPTAYNGIMAAAPAINWPSLLVADYWPQFVMNQLKTFPPGCVVDAVTAAAVKSCDGLDGVVDGVISAPGLCQFDPLTLVNSQVDCNGSSVSITKNDALVVKKAWEGLRSSNGSSLWYGLEKGAPLSGQLGGSLIDTNCTSQSTCIGVPFSIAADWISLWILQNPSADLTKLSHEQLDQIFFDSKARYESIIGTDNPDLSAFRQAGGKMITWHGLADQLIFSGGTERYYKQVEALDSSVRDFYRFFEAPGVHHCDEGNGPIPVDPLGAVVAWLEDGAVPETLAATTADGTGHRNLCPFPLVSAYNGGNTKDASSYVCQERY